MRETSSKRPLHLRRLTSSLKVIVSLTWGLVVSVSLAATPDSMQKHVEVVVPPQLATTSDKLPTVLMLQGTGGGNIRAELWTSWFNERGVATVIIDSAAARGVSTLSGVLATHQASDVSAALALIESHPRVDLTRYAVMGFSRGGTAALEVGAVLTADQPRPQFVFALYPGLDGTCPNSLDERTKIMVFYGDQDDWGSYKNTRNGCRRMVEGASNASFHLLVGAQHGYDDLSSAAWTSDRRTFTSKPSQAALTETREAILDAVGKAWGIK